MLQPLRKNTLFHPILKPLPFAREVGVQEYKVSIRSLPVYHQRQVSPIITVSPERIVQAVVHLHKLHYPACLVHIELIVVHQPVFYPVAFAIVHKVQYFRQPVSDNTRQATAVACNMRLMHFIRESLFDEMRINNDAPACAGA
jgi:hypothetical protein